MPIFAANCAQAELCHGGFSTASEAHRELVGIAAMRDACNPGLLVAPGDLSHSYLVRKLLGVGLCPGTTRMPIADPLSASEIQAIEDWICAGALDD